MPRLHFIYFLAVILWQVSAQVKFPDGQLKQARENHRPKEISLTAIEKLSNLSKSNNLNDVLKRLLVERVVGTPSHEQVRNFIVEYMRKLGWQVELDEFEDETPIFGKLKFSNIVATLNPKAERFLVLACHYDSKYFPNQVFIGATDSAVPCAMMLDIASSMQSFLNAQKSGSLGLQMVFFDGEEAFQQWGPKDSIYGARHLAERWEAEDKLKRIDMLVLLDLLGTPDPNFYSYFQNTESWYAQLLSVEERLDRAGHMDHYTYSSVAPNQRTIRYFQPRSYYAYIEDDHIPFLQRGVPILHLIPTPFPDVWHKLSDDGSAVDISTVQNLIKVFRVFIAEYLHLDV
ncbi:glutaminyl-peptide cyclotransferase [Malaya genurostris]|uniref:glutaminyl-peptide cyclotransferase n=1 Tax=Malaya genurostris TaxID=325434 RepID=UPI0026F3DE67|nr:glutaminyl-peptide cyclotransferase [Malaya genurostris]XP_058451696.1 glutaminyl-peptide cyclotransferase [Malaya genurostris]